MASKSNDMPEGTGTTIAGSSGGLDDSGGGETAAAGGVAEKLRTQASEIGSQASAKVLELRGQATDQVFAFAAQGKDRATEALDGTAKLLSDAAAQVEEKLGGQAGAFARQAADAVSGFATTLRAKEVDELLDDTRSLVKRSPALAIGAAAAAGFLLARVIKAGSATPETAAQSFDTDSKPAGGPSTGGSKANGSARD